MTDVTFCTASDYSLFFPPLMISRISCSAVSSPIANTILFIYSLISYLLSFVMFCGDYIITIKSIVLFLKLFIFLK